MGTNVNPILEWTNQHPYVDVRICWSDSMSRYKVEMCMTERHKSILVEKELFEEFPDKILDEMLSSEGFIYGCCDVLPKNCPNCGARISQPMTR